VKITALVEKFQLYYCGVSSCPNLRSSRNGHAGTVALFKATRSHWWNYNDVWNP